MGHDVTRQPCSDPAQSETLRMSGSDLHGSWEISSAPEAKLGTGGAGKAKSRNPVVHAGEKSDTSVVPRKPPNKGDDPAEVVEERDVAKGNTSEPPRLGHRAEIKACRWDSMVYAKQHVGVRRCDSRHCCTT